MSIFYKKAQVFKSLKEYMKQQHNKKGQIQELAQRFSKIYAKH